MITENREDYLTEILKIQEDGKKITGKHLSENLNISQASVSEMLKKLKGENLVNKNNTLTEAGRAIAEDVVSKHRLWEKFLVDKLGISWKDVHTQADLFEHVTEDETLEALNKFLGYPKVCPHGGSIYRNMSSTLEIKKLEELKVNESGNIIKVRDDKDLLNYIEEKNIKIGDKVTILKIDKFDGQRSIKIGKNELTLSPKACRMIYID